jgi:hypothetical protein
MSVTLFGTCRINCIPNNQLNEMINYCQSTKEIIQFIHYLKGELTIPPPYNMVCFRTGICNNKNIEYNENFKKLFLETDVFVIEISSNKKYIHNNFYLHHLCVDDRFKDYNHVTPPGILQNYIVEKQSDEEIENDIFEIQSLLHPKKIVIVSHYNSKLNGEYIPSRNHLICLLDDLCKKYNILFINPTEVLSHLRQEAAISDDLTHYSTQGFYEFTTYLYHYVRRLLGI